MVKNKMTSKYDNKNLNEFQPDSRGEICFRLKGPSQEAEFIHILFAERIPHTWYYGDVFATSLKDKSKLVDMGFKIDEVDMINLDALSLNERNEIKNTAREYWLETRDEAIDEFLAKYGDKNGE